MSHQNETVLVTGATGFVAGHCLLQLLEDGYQVRTSVRSLSREQEVRDALAPHVSTENLSFVTLDLTKDDGWAEALKGCKYLLHVASPFPVTEPKHEDELIIPARDGALRALRAAAKAGVCRTVLTSSVVAVAYGVKQQPDYIYTEDDWSNIEGDINAYAKSKTIAEHAAWQFMETPDAGTMELAVINPSLILGPLLSRDYSTSGELILKLLNGSIPACPKVGFNCIDVRDVAAAHIAAMTNPRAAGQRHILVSEFGWMRDISKALRAAGYKTPTKDLPNFLVHLLAIFDPAARQIITELGHRPHISSARAREVLDLELISIENMSLEMAHSMVELGVVKPKML